MNRRTLLRCGALAALVAVLPAAVARRPDEVHGRQERPGVQRTGDATYTRQPLNTWTAAQVGAFLDAIQGHRLHPLYHLAAYTGMRRGELCGLSWDDVDLDAGRITVRWQITGSESGCNRSRPKTLGEARGVDLDEATTEVLRTWRERQSGERTERAAGYAHLRDRHGLFRPVFTRDNGSPLDPQGVSRQFAGLTERAGLGRRSLHGLRKFAMWVGRE